MKNIKDSFNFDIYSFILIFIIMIPNCIYFLYPTQNDILNYSNTKILDFLCNISRITLIISLLFFKSNKKYLNRTLKNCLIFLIYFMIILYFCGWILYYLDIVNLYIILDLTIAPSFSLILYSIYRYNIVAFIFALIFTICHIIDTILNFIV